MKAVIDLVDSVEYTTTNCFGHQLHKVLCAKPGVKTIALADVHNHERPELIISRLKQRTLHHKAAALRKWAGDTPVVVFDQDPWEAFNDRSPHKGAYDVIRNELNVKTFALTTRWWCDFLAKRGYPTLFTRMWLLPEYCDSNPGFVERRTQHGFIGQNHSYRQTLFSSLNSMGVCVESFPGGQSYEQFLKTLSTFQTYVHAESSMLVVDGQRMNLSSGLWIKDVEAAARGCFAIRNKGVDSQSYLEGINTVFLYDQVSDIPELLNNIQKMDVEERQSLLDTTVEFIKRSNKWSETADSLLAVIE